ncbi:hypothetical protein TNCV_944161 [Trichonephila clavipes]|nr:hypothetical protein TNCV_944161 [Trichonephila clavipes]
MAFDRGDALACLLFNLALEKVLRDSNINTEGNIFNKSIELLTFADDIARTPTALRLIFREGCPQDRTENQGRIRPSACLALNHVLTIPVLKLKLLTASLI